MKTKSIIIAALALLAFSSSALAQEQIKELFQRISSMNGIGHSENKTVTQDSTGRPLQDNVVHIISVGQPNFRIFDQLKKTFDSESSHATMAYTHINDASKKDDASQRQQWRVAQQVGPAIVVGSMKNSSYMLLSFDDKERTDFRTLCAVEWWNTDDPLIREAQLVYAYGPKPQTYDTRVYGSAQLPDNLRFFSRRLPAGQLPEGLEQRLEELRNMPDSIFSINLERLNIGKPQDIPFDDETMGGWMNKAMKNISHLSNRDWHRVFGLLTQQMLDHANNEPMEDMVVAANLVLDLCKHADQLEDDERDVCARRLRQVATQMSKSQYVADLLNLAAKRLLKK